MFLRSIKSCVVLGYFMLNLVTVFEKLHTVASGIPSLPPLSPCISVTSQPVLWLKIAVKTPSLPASSERS